MLAARAAASAKPVKSPFAASLIASVPAETTLFATFVTLLMAFLKVLPNPILFILSCYRKLFDMLRRFVERRHQYQRALPSNRSCHHDCRPDISNIRRPKTAW